MSDEELDSEEEEVVPEAKGSQQFFPEYAYEALNAHNEYRHYHEVPDLKLTEKLCKFAQEWANTCAKNRNLVPRDNNPYGECLYSCLTSQMTDTEIIRAAIDCWYDEIKKFSFGVENGKKGSLHFTQMIWKDTSEVGFGIAVSKKNEVHVVANYHPKGNMAGKFAENVPKPFTTLKSGK